MLESLGRIYEVEKGEFRFVFLYFPHWFHDLSQSNLRNYIAFVSTYTFPDGSSYDGEWKENIPNGWGLFR